MPGWSPASTRPRSLGRPVSPRLHRDRLPPGLAGHGRFEKLARPGARPDRPLVACTSHGLAGNVEEIDRLNISRPRSGDAARLRAPARPADAALVDSNGRPPCCHVETVVRGDPRSLSIAAASMSPRSPATG